MVAALRGLLEEPTRAFEIAAQLVQPRELIGGVAVAMTCGVQEPGLGPLGLLPRPQQLAEVVRRVDVPGRGPLPPGARVVILAPVLVQPAELVGGSNVAALRREPEPVLRGLRAPLPPEQLAEEVGGFN